MIQALINSIHDTDWVILTGGVILLLLIGAIALMLSQDKNMDKED